LCVFWSSGFIEAEHLKEGGATFLLFVAGAVGTGEVDTSCVELHLGGRSLAHHIVLHFLLLFDFGDELLLKGELGAHVGDF